MKKVVLSAVALATAMVAGVGVPAASSDGLPSGERVRGHGNAAVEPAYNADTGDLLYLLTPVHVPFPSKASAHATSPLYLVEYPPGFPGTLNCMGLPGNCPDHDAEVAGFATMTEPTVYGGNPAALPGHDHIVDPPGAPDWNVAWEVVEVLFTPKAVSDGMVTHLTTDTAIEAAKEAGYVTEHDLGFAFNCSAVPASVYYNGTPVGGAG